MIAYKPREGRRAKALKMAKNIERLFKEGKCRECSVVVTRMDFAKILGKFTKVKIQYESSSPKTPKVSENLSSKSNGRLKNNENGMVVIPKKLHDQPVKESQRIKRNKLLKTEVSSPKSYTPKHTNNILKENNVQKKVIPKIQTVNLNNNVTNANRKQYAIIFNDPKNNNSYESKSEFTLKDLLPNVDKTVLPTEEWSMEYFPKNSELKDDKVYDRIAAELEDLMRSEQPPVPSVEASVNQVDEFPSIMDILNDNTTTKSEQKDRRSSLEFKGNLDSSDVEAMLLGKSDNSKSSEPTPMEVDNTDVNQSAENAEPQSNVTIDVKEAEKDEKLPEIINDCDLPHSPSILDEALKKGIEEHLPNDNVNEEKSNNENEEKSNNENEEKSNNENEEKSNNACEETNKQTSEQENVCNNSNNLTVTVCNQDELENTPKDKEVKEEKNQLELPMNKLENIMYVTFKKIVDGKCLKSVTCPKNLVYTIELNEKTVEFVGAPKHISTLEDLQVLLQIVNESELSSPYVLH